MKKLLLFACLSITSLAFNQTIVIQVNEVQSFYGDPTWSIEQVVNDPYYVESPRRVDCKYIINFKIIIYFTNIRNNTFTNVNKVF